MKGILGRKRGMTGVFTKDGKLTPVTVIEVNSNVITQIKTKETDGYEAIQLAFEEKPERLANKAEKGHFKKSNTTPKRFLKELRGVDVTNMEVGTEIKGDIFTVGEMVDVSGTSKGKGFQGVIKRHNQSRGPMGHGSHYHRGPGSMGTLRPMRVFKGKNLPGHMGSETVTIQNLEIMAVDLENNVILVKGNVPGPKNSVVFVKSAIKNDGVVNKKFSELVSYVEISDVEETPEETVNEEVVSEVAEVTEEETNEVKEAEKDVSEEEPSQE